MTDAMTDEVTLPIKQAAHLLGYSERQINRRYEAAGRGRYRIPRMELESVVASSAVEAPRAPEMPPVGQRFAESLSVATAEYIAVLERLVQTERETRLALQEALRGRLAS